MSLETIVKNMVTAKEPESNIARVIKHYNQINTSPLKNTEENECDEGWVKNEAGECVPEEKVKPGSSIDENVWTQNRGVSAAEKAAMEQYEKEQKLKKEKEERAKLAQEQQSMQDYIDGSDKFKEGFTPNVKGVEVVAQAQEKEETEDPNGAQILFAEKDKEFSQKTKPGEGWETTPGMQAKKTPDVVPLSKEDIANEYLVGEYQSNEDAHLYWLTEAIKVDPVTSTFANNVVNGSQEVLNTELAKLKENNNITKERRQKIYEDYIAQNPDIYNKGISDILAKYNVGEWVDGKWQYDAHMAQDPEWIKNSEIASKEINQFMTDLAYNALLLNADYQKDFQNVNAEYNKFRLDLVKDAAANSDVYDERIKELSNTVADKLGIVTKDYLEERYGGSNWQQFHKSTYIIPQSWNDFGGVLNLDEIDRLEKLKKEVLNAKPDKNGIIKIAKDRVQLQYGPSPTVEYIKIGPGEEFKTQQEYLEYLTKEQNEQGEKYLESVLNSKEYQNTIDKFENIQFFDQDGMTIDDVTGSIFEQIPQFFAALGTFGIHTGMTEAASIAKRTIFEQSAQEYVKNNPGATLDDFANLSAEEQAGYAIELLKAGGGNLDKAYRGGLAAMGVDMAGNLVTFGAMKVPYNISLKAFKMFFAQSLKNIRKQSLGAFKRATVPTAFESGAEVTQEIIQDIQFDRGMQDYYSQTVERQGSLDELQATGDSRYHVNFGKDKNLAQQIANTIMDPERRANYQEVAMKTLISTAGMINAGKAGSSLYDSVLKSSIPYLQSGELTLQQMEDFHTANYEDTINQIDLDNSLSQREKRIKKEEAADAYADKMEGTKIAVENLNNQTLRNLSLDDKVEWVKAELKYKEAKGKLKALKEKLKEDPNSVFSNELREAEEQVRKTENNKRKIVGRGLYLLDKKEVAEIVNNATEGVLANKRIIEVKTKKEIDAAIDEIVDNRDDLSDEAKASEKERLKNEDNIIQSLKGENTTNASHGVMVPGTNTAIFVEENVKESPDIAGASNVINHEVTHFIWENATQAELDGFKDAFIQKIEKEGDARMQQALQQALVIAEERVMFSTLGQGKEVKSQEFISALSDAMRGLEIESLTKANRNLFKSVGNDISNIVYNVTDGKLDRKFTPEQAFDFVKNFNNFLADSVNYELLFKGKDISPGQTLPSTAISPASLENAEAINEAYENNPNDVNKILWEGVEPNTKGLRNQIANNMYRAYPEYGENAYAREDFISDMITGTENNPASSLQGLIKSYDPSEGPLSAYIVNNLPQRAKRIFEDRIGKQATTGAYKADTAAAKEVADTGTRAQEISFDAPIREELKLPLEANEKIDKALNDAVGNVINKLTAGKPLSIVKTLAARDEAFYKTIDDVLYDEIQNVVGKGKTFDNFIDKNFPLLRNIVLNNIESQKGKGQSLKWKEKPPTKEEFKNYYRAANELPSTKSDRKRKLVKAIIKEISKQERENIVLTNPIIADEVETKTGITLASMALNMDYADQFNYTPYSIYSGEKNSDGIYKGAIQYVKDVKKFINKFEALEPEGGIINPGTFGVTSIFNSEAKDREATTKYLQDEINKKKIPYLGISGTGKGRGKTPVSKLKTSKSSGEKPLSTVGAVKQFLKERGPEFFEKYNADNEKLFRDFWNATNEILSKNKDLASAVYWMLNTTVSERAHPHSLARVETANLSGKNTEKLLWEHAVPNSYAYQTLFKSILDPKQNFKNTLDKVVENYTLMGFTTKQAKQIDAAGFKKSMPNVNNNPFNILTDSYTERYTQTPGLDLTTQTPISNRPNPFTKSTLASAALDLQFNEMLERTKGVKADAIYSEARAKKMGAKKGFKFFVPYSAEDFLGLIYPTLGKGKQGDADLKWWTDNVMQPYNQGMQDFESAKQAAMLEWKELKKQIRNTPSNLRKEAVRDFNNEDAVRVYLWDKNNTLPDNIAKKDVKELVRHVNNNPSLKEFADQLNTLHDSGFPAPTAEWLSGTITTDLVNYINTETRAQYLQNWQNAVDRIFTPDNLNKLRATYGNNYVEALQDSLYRMKSGRNRPAGTNRITNTWLNWLNDSVGTVMFLNQRSALLQTISSVNFLNWTDNNPAKAAMAFANQKQFWNDFVYLFNSDFLKQRRSGLKTDVNADEIARSAATSPNKARAAASWLLKKGFLPTQIADSFAISIGGASFYRNRVNTYMNQGMSKKEAEEKAFLDFRNNTTESQQSADPSRISMQQASPLGRVILAFANTPIQYTRLTKRAIQDLQNGRGDWKTNVSKIVYYGAVQNIIFTGLQQALFGMLFDDDEPVGEKEAQFKQDRKEGSILKLINSSADTILRGSGVGGAFVAMLKNLALEAKRQSEKSRPDYERVADKLFSFSPVIDSKFRKLQSAGRTFTYKQELKKIQERGVAIDNPALMAAAQTLSAFANIPLDRAIKKINNLKTMTEEETKLWQQIALFMGYGEWELGIQARKVDEERAKVKKEKEEEKKYKNLQKNINKGTKKKSPVKALQHGVLGRANRDGTIEVAPGLSPKKRAEVIRHEKLHQKEMKSGKLDYDDNFVYYGKKKFERKNGKIAHAGKWKSEGDHSLPWEKFAHKHD